MSKPKIPATSLSSDQDKLSSASDQGESSSVPDPNDPVFWSCPLLPFTHRDQICNLRRYTHHIYRLSTFSYNLSVCETSILLRNLLEFHLTSLTQPSLTRVSLFMRLH